MKNHSAEPTVKPMIRLILTILGMFQLTATAVGQPQPGTVFREYLWTNRGGDAGGSLRVGGRLDYGGGPILLPHTFDLEHSTRAEIVLEKLLCHDGTRGLAFSVNSNQWMSVPEAPAIPEPQWDYQHHIEKHGAHSIPELTCLRRETSTAPSTFSRPFTS